MKFKKKRVKLLFIFSLFPLIIILIYQKSQQNQPIFVDLKYSLTTFPTCKPSQEWIELDGETFLRKNTSKYFLDEKKFVIIFTCKADSLNNKKFEFHFTIKYKNKVFQKFNDNKYELIRFFNIRRYQNFVLKAHLDLDEFIVDKESIVDLAELSVETVILLKSLNSNILKTSSSTVKPSIGNFRKRKNLQRNAATSGDWCAISHQQCFRNTPESTTMESISVSLSRLSVGWLVNKLHCFASCVFVMMSLWT
jgi:hypothetical protein